MLRPDGRPYRVVAVGKQTWLAENLDHAVDGSWCYRDDTTACDRYGRFYDWETALKVCPKGWRLPGDRDWDRLASFLGGEDTAGRRLKAVEGWFREGNGVDDVGFSALPAGHRYTDGGSYGQGAAAFFWSSSPQSAEFAWFRYLASGSDTLKRDLELKTNGHSVRCVMP